MAVDSGIPFARKHMISVLASDMARTNAAHMTTITPIIFLSCSGDCESCDIIFQDHGTFFSKIVLPFFQGGVIFFSKVVLSQGDVYYSFPTSKKLLFKNHLKNAS